MDHFTEIKTILLGLPTIHQWPALKELLTKNTSRPHFDWELPWYTARAVGFENEAVSNGAAALACMHMSIILIDDILDDDPKGIHNKVGSGQTANIAQALQAAAFLLLAQADITDEIRVAAISLISRMGLETSFGQQMDSTLDDLTEEQYWSLVRAKSVPFYKTAMELGGVMSGINQYGQSVLGDLGTCLGEMIQIHDDMRDALEKPANPDWLQNRPNLLILYAKILDYPGKQRFAELREQVNNPSALAEAQKILIQCDAAGYAFYQLIKRNDYAKERIYFITQSPGLTGIVDTSPLESIFDQQIEPIITLLKRHHIPLPNNLRYVL